MLFIALVRWLRLAISFLLCKVLDLNMSKANRPTAMRTLLGWGVLGQLVYVVSQFVTLLALTRFATVAEVGIYGLATAVVIPVFFFFDLNIRMNVAASNKSAYSFHDFRNLLLISASIGFLIVLFIGGAAFSGSALTILVILAATKVAESLSNFSYGVFQRFDRMQRVAGSLILRSMGGTLVFVLFLLNGVPIEFAFLGQLFVWTTIALFIDLFQAHKLWRAQGAPEGFVPIRTIELARNSVFLALNGLLSALQGNTPRYVIGWLLGVVALGQFTVVGYAMQAISTVAMSAMQSLASRFNRLISDQEGRVLWGVLRRIFVIIILCAVIGVGLSLMFGDRLVQAAFGRDYAHLGGLLAICVLAAALRSGALALQMCLLAARRFRQNLLIRLWASSAMVILCIIGGSQAGLTGIAWGMCAALIVHVAALAVAVQPLGKGGLN
ncbi:MULTISPECIES: lipopolysaccharide biosynthesis protein [unclassified Sulfitobacter]|uniref:lipopolysaccharide biosynthesis protein n=1 Tax=unclassified Sulfitobacter TaxID=196795 RepID=UPI0037454DB3